MGRPWENENIRGLLDMPELHKEPVQGLNIYDNFDNLELDDAVELVISVESGEYKLEPGDISIPFEDYAKDVRKRYFEKYGSDMPDDIDLLPENMEALKREMEMVNRVESGESSIILGHGSVSFKDYAEDVRRRYFEKYGFRQ